MKVYHISARYNNSSLYKLFFKSCVSGMGIILSKLQLHTGP